MPDVNTYIICPTSAQAVFAYLNDYRNMPKFILGLSHCTPVGEQLAGLGTRVECAGKIGPATLRACLEVCEWDPDGLLAIQSIDGFNVRARFVLHAVDDSVTKVAVTASYSFGKGLAGRATNRTMEPVAKATANQILSSLRKQLSELEDQSSS